MIIEIDFPTIKEIWTQYLWPERKSAIETHSTMMFLNGYDLKNFNFTPTFLAYTINDKIAGVNSGHMCLDNQYRSRGLYVFPEHRNQGIGVILLRSTMEIAKKENAKFIWSYPKQTSWNTYSRAGFILASSWEQSELGSNAYCVRYL